MSRISGITGTSNQSFAIDSDGYNIKLSVENNEIVIRDNLNNKQSIDITSGGTGQTTYATGDILYSNATDSLAKRSVGSAGQVLTVAGGIPTWATAAGIMGVAYGTTGPGPGVGYKNTAVGRSWRYSTDSNYNSLSYAYNSLAIGDNAGYCNNATSFGDANIFIGNYAHDNCSSLGIENINIGNNSVQTNAGVISQTITLGYCSLRYSTYQDRNATGSIAIGNNAGNNCTFSNTIMIGNNSALGDIWTATGAYVSPNGDNNIFIGNGSGSTLGHGGDSHYNTNLSNAMAIGRHALVGANSCAVIGATDYPINMGINMTTPTARLHLPAGTATAGTAPLKLTTGTALSAVEDGAMEYHGSHLYFSIGSTRYQLDQQGGLIGSTTNGKTILGYGSAIAANAGGVCIGSNTNLTGDGLQSVVIGDNARADYQSVVIGNSANSLGGVVENLMAIGTAAGAFGLDGFSTLVGNYSGYGVATGGYSTIIGHYACQSTTQSYTISLGYKARTTGNNSIVIGTANSNNWFDGKGANTIMIGNTSQTDTYLQPNALRIGTTLAGDKYIYAQNADTNKPYIKYDDTANEWQLSNNGTIVNAINTKSRNSNWWNSGVTPTTTSADGYSVPITGLTVKPGEPVRILDKSGVVFSSAFPKINSTAIIGVTGNILDYRGCLYFKSKTSADPTFYFDVYSDELCTNLVATTSTFNASVSDTYTLTLSAGLTGTISVTSIVEVRSSNIVHRVAMMHTGICTSYDGTTLKFAGQAISTTAGNILEVWLGNPSVVVQYPIDIAGSYATATTSTAFQDRQLRTPYWDQSNAILCMVKARNTTNDTGATQAAIAMVINGNQVVSDGSALLLNTARVSTLVEMTSNLQEINFGDSLEMRVIAGTNSNSQDLQGSAIFVLV